MATCRKLTLRERVTAAEREAGGKLTADARAALELGPSQYSCTGADVGGLRGTKPKHPKRSRAR